MIKRAWSIIYLSEKYLPTATYALKCMNISSKSVLCFYELILLANLHILSSLICIYFLYQQRIFTSGKLYNVILGIKTLEPEEYHLNLHWIQNFKVYTSKDNNIHATGNLFRILLNWYNWSWVFSVLHEVRLQSLYISTVVF